MRIAHGPAATVMLGWVVLACACGDRSPPALWPEPPPPTLAVPIGVATPEVAKAAPAAADDASGSPRLAAESDAGEAESSGESPARSPAEASADAHAGPSR